MTLAELRRLGRVEREIPALVERGEVWRLFTYQFLHGGLAHLLLNMFALWMFAANYLRRSSRAQDDSKDPALAQKRTNFAAPGIVFFVLSVTLFVTDLIMSMSPHWYSTMFRPIFVVGPVLANLALYTLILCRNADYKPLNKIITPDLTKDLGNWMFTFTLLWAYFNFSQYLIIWNGNLPSTVGYYYARSVQQWNVIGGILIVCHFFVPFFALLAPRVKASTRALTAVCVWILIFRFVDVYYTIAPMYRANGPMPVLSDALAFLGVGGIWFFFFGSQLRGASIYPLHDMRLLEATEHA